MKRVMAINIGILTMGLLLTACGKKAQPVTGGNGVVPQYGSSQMSAQVSSLVNQMYGMRMDQGIRVMQGNGISSTIQKYGCTNSSNTNSQNVSWLGGLIQINWGVNNSVCSLSLLETITFTSAVQDQAQLVNGSILTRQAIMDKTFNPDANALLVKGCNGTISPMISASTRGGSNSSQFIDMTYREDCPNNQPYLLHYITTEVNLQRPLAAHPLSVVVVRSTQQTNNQYSQVTQVKQEYKNFIY